ncbi:MAG: hypothetical protein RI964_2787 [Pseudomonadota bacterium]|jgi:hypothetical protein
MMQRKDIPIWRDATQLLLAVEQAVRHFPRYHKYTLGTEMRQQAMKICQLVSRSWQDKARAPETLPRLVLAVDDLKIQLQLGRELPVFRYLKGGLKRRIVYRLVIQPGVELCPS